MSHCATIIFCCHLGQIHCYNCWVWTHCELQVFFKNNKKNRIIITSFFKCYSNFVLGTKSCCFDIVVAAAVTGCDRDIFRSVQNRKDIYNAVRKNSFTSIVRVSSIELSNYEQTFFWLQKCSKEERPPPSQKFLTLPQLSDRSAPPLSPSHIRFYHFCQTVIFSLISYHFTFPR